ncbi:MULTISPECIES: Rrf2 family transcriptional regulator [Paraburkholderia]|uniref:DNA-binding IscR family transcriptional regulator n=2 Tax=Paraburkholderia TaxID=1822464 RepID=A0A7Y9WR18_9BURK|nr:Rrf2 family transcriptional regulator [Paraburkholderia bryophila]NYH16083.1 DNA-binding IscR family transcriptional regulator [Paraburkholderia bryophila]NYH25482.1 DNA-binding IscR family transcriptional regulator [Paraburkholderia bryophila]
MRTDSRLSRMLHVLIHMDRHDGPLTSETIAQMLRTHAVVVRRMLAGLRDQGYVRSEKGHGGGWVLAEDLDKLTLLDVYRAVGEPPLFSELLTDDDPQCLVEQAVNAGLSKAMQEAETALLARFGELTVGALARDFDERFARVKQGEQGG